MKTFQILLFLFSLLFFQEAKADPDYHFVGWANLFVPGLGETLLGHPIEGAFEMGYEVSTFWVGYRLTEGSLFSLDGFASPNPTSRARAGVELSLEQKMYGQILQEFGIKAHMINTFAAYQDAAKLQGELPSDMEHLSPDDLFMEPFNTKNLNDEWVSIPLGIVFASVVADYISQTGSGSLGTQTKLNPASNALYALNFGLWQPMGSGAPEEMFYRGFLQREFKHATGSAAVSVALTSTLFAFSHEPGAGRNSAAIAGLYLGYLAERYGGKLGPGITLHFWSEILLGLETILLNAKGQRNAPPASLSVQVNL